MRSAARGSRAFSASRPGAREGCRHHPGRGGGVPPRRSPGWPTRASASFAARAHRNASRPDVPHPTTKTAAGRGRRRFPRPRSGPRRSRRARYVRDARDDVSGCARPGSASWCSARSSASLSAIARRTPGAPSASSARPCGDTRSVGGTASSETRGGGMTRGAPRRRRARPARRRVWRRERPRTRAARTLKTFGAGPNLDSSEPIARKPVSEERNARRSQRAPRVPGRCRSCITRSRHVPLARLLIPSPLAVDARGAHPPRAPRLPRRPPAARAPSRFPSRGARSRRPLARVRALAARRDTSTRAACGHAALVEDRLAGRLGALSARPRRTRRAPQRGDATSTTPSTSSSKVRETRVPTLTRHVRTPRRTSVRLRPLLEPFAFAIRPTRPPTTTRRPLFLTIPYPPHPPTPAGRS